MDLREAIARSLDKYAFITRRDPESEEYCFCASCEETRERERAIAFDKADELLKIVGQYQTAD